MTDERFEEFLKHALEDMDPVPTPPREVMWAQIDEARRFSRRAERKSKRSAAVWVSWGVGLAAMLALGVGIGRLTVQQQLPGVAPVQTAAQPELTTNETPYQVAVAQHLSRAEVLLTSFRTQSGAASLEPQLVQIAGDLLTSTRLLLDSPAGRDPQVAALLADLELILAQIAGMSVPSTEEREIIQDGLNRTAVLPRLRATTTGPAAAGT